MSIKDAELRIKKLEAEIKQLKSCKRYGLVWEHKPENVVEQCKKELPVLEEMESRAILKDENKPTNLLIEGDNYHALSVLNYTHKGKIDVIYIDPPYNTGNEDFIYNDKFVDKEDAFRHSKWISFVEKRLKLAKSLLREAGLIFISIDDNEYANLKILCDGVFGEENFRASITIKGNPRGRDYGGVARMHDYLLIYSKSEISKINSIFDSEKIFPFEDSIGGYETRELRNRNVAFNIGNRPNLYYPFYINPIKEVDNGFLEISLERKRGWVELYPKESQGVKTVWRWGMPKSRNNLNVDIVAKKMRDGGYQIVEKYRKREKMARSIWDDKDVNTEKGTLLVKKILNKKTFGYPKPMEMIKRIVEMGSSSKKSIILDFFAGSGTTGHAVLDLNEQDGGYRQFILCTNNENNISTKICYPRIKNVIDGYADIDGIPSNLRYFKTSFVPKSDVSDDMRKILVRKSTDMICVKESAYDKKYDNKEYKIYMNKQYSVGILFNLDKIDDFKMKLQKVGLEAHIYVFSLSNDTFDSDFDDLEVGHSLIPIPESILEVYRKLFG